MQKAELLNNTEAIIFDFDGTLVDSMWVWVNIDEEYLEKYDLTEPENFHEDMEGMSYTEVAQYFADVFPTLNCTTDEIMDEWMQMAHEKYITEVPLKDGAKEFLDAIKTLGIKIGIASSNSKELVTDALKALGIYEMFDSVRSACEVNAGKPSPDVYLLVAEDLGVSPDQCLVFEDVPMGILAGKNAGMRVCAVDDVYARKQEEKIKNLADYYIKDYCDITNETYEVL